MTTSNASERISNAGQQASGLRPGRRLDIALIALFFAVVAPFVQSLTAQGGPRYALPSAIVEHGTVQLDDYEPIIGVDRVEIGGHIYSDKAPGQPFLGVPIAAVAKLLGAEPATEGRVEGNLGAWAQSVVFCTMPAALLLALMRRHANQYVHSSLAALAAVSLSFGTMLLPLSSNLYGHMLTASLLFASWHLLDSRGSNIAIAAAGGCAALAVIVEYPSALVAAVLSLWALYHHRLRGAAIFAAPLAMAVGVIVLHNRLVYGTNTTGYSSPSKGATGQLNFIKVPDFSNVFSILFGARGFIFTPVVLVGAYSLIVGIWRRRPEYIVPAAALGGLFLLQAGWSNPWGGSGPGPRYIAPALPFLVVPVAHVLRDSSSRARATVVGMGVVTMGLVLVTYELLPIGGMLISTHLRYLTGDHGLNPTVFTMAFGPVGWIVHLGLVTAAVVHLRRVWPREGTGA